MHRKHCSSVVYCCCCCCGTLYPRLQGKNRMIASGLRAAYTLEEMQGRRVTVLANLKARNLGLSLIHI